MLTVTPAQITINDNGVPYSTQFSENYFSTNGGIEECEHVFINGNNFSSRIKNSEQFTVAEIGFGTGLNAWLTALKQKDNRHNEKRRTVRLLPQLFLLLGEKDF